MYPVDPVRLSKTMAFLLRHRPEVGQLEPDGQGWVPVEALCAAVSRILRVEVRTPDVQRLVEEAPVRRFEIEGERIRAVRETGRRKGRGGSRSTPPDILYHATTERRLAGIRELGMVSAGPDRPVYLSDDEAQAWRVAHRLGGPPRVLYVDAGRARRRGVKFWKNRRTGLFMASPIPVAHVLNLQEGFEEQLSAGGIPVSFDERGQALVALIEVTRRSGVTWEVAKGKLEPGEPPELAGVREVQEEMGVTCDLHITRQLDTLRYGFLAPGGLPRLKTVYLYLMEPEGDMACFDPATREGIGAVRWFPIDEACRLVRHASLIPVMHKAREILEQGPGYARAAALPPALQAT